MNNLLKRSLTGIIFVSVVVALVLLNEFSFFILLLLIGAGALYEFYSIVFVKKPGIPEFFMILIGLCLFQVSTFKMPLPFLYLLGIFFSLTGIIVLLSKDRSWIRIAWYSTGLIYIILPLILFNRSVSMNGVYNEKLALNIFILVWFSDTFAYVSGKLFGKRKLFPEVSPGKTWEGLAGSLILSVTFSYFIAIWFDLPTNMNMFIAVITVFTGTLGDLIQSMLKREYGLKDSGNILPGHGGVLDRFDALFISLPFTSFCYYLFLGDYII